MFRQFSPSDLSIVDQGVIDQYCLAEERGSIARSYDPRYESDLEELIPLGKEKMISRIEKKRELRDKLQRQISQVRENAQSSMKRVEGVRVTIDGVMCADGEGCLLLDIIKIKALYKCRLNQTELESFPQCLDEIRSHIDGLAPETFVLITEIFKRNQRTGIPISA